MKLRLLIGSVLALCLTATATFAQEHARRGTVLGGVTGAIAGAAIGNENDEAGAGALIGGAIGAITGAVIGDSVDQDITRSQIVREQRLQFQLQTQRRAVSVLDVLAMKQNGLSDAVVINHIRENGVRERLEVSDVITLHRQGLSDTVITAMQQASPRTYVTQARPTYSAPVYVEQHHYVAPRVITYPQYTPRYHHHHYHHPPRPSSSFGWSVRVGR